MVGNEMPASLTVKSVASVLAVPVMPPLKLVTRTAFDLTTTVKKNTNNEKK